MSRMGTLFIEGDSIFHRLDGTVKMLLLLTWTVLTFFFLDVRVFTVMLVAGFLLLGLARIPFRMVRPLLWVMIVFNLLNSLFIVLLTPGYGTVLTGTNTEVLHWGFLHVNWEILFYVLTLSMKYANLLPITLIFIFTTHPSHFASSLNKIGISYKIAYAVNIAFRYIPDIQDEFKNILNSQQARGVSFKRGEAPLLQRIKHIAAIAIPLVTSSLQRIETVSNAMELRGFGKHKKRTWYNATPFQAVDFIAIGLCIVAIVGAVVLKARVLQEFWYPL